MNRAHRVMVLGGIVAASIGGTSVAFGSGGGNSSASVLVPIVPCRLMDTRPGTDNVGPRATPIGANSTYTIDVWGTNGHCTVPTSATGIDANVTAVNGTAASFLTLFPADADRPLASNLNWTAGAPPTPNNVTVKLSSDGKLSLYNMAGSVDVVIDLVGYYEPAPVGAGEKGDKGDKGDTGTAGTSGAAGPQGPQGPQGPAGQDGEDGVDGTNGEDGVDGVDGTNGTDGVDGQNGQDGVDGAQGPEGPQGPQGPAGNDGAAGAAGAAGAQGPEGPEGPQGPAGNDGAAGAAGAAGAQGPEGPAGPQGPEGPAGPQGPAGTNATSGYQIVTGATGVINNGNPTQAFTTSCPADKKVVGGGYSTNDINTVFTTHVDGPSADGQSWLVTLTRSVGTAQVTPYAICMTAS
jgi:hypothetical protein